MAGVVEKLLVDRGESKLGWHFGAWNWSSSLGLVEEVLGSTIQVRFNHSGGYGMWCDVGVGASTGQSKAKIGR